ncbi:MAG TPA: UvrD-helicase domain-containing protein, partial [Solirubrobacteraceae bacterium]|nr:UvrD-helicase domain-containing protein [Solirubrobacteraceae bacterium]
KAADVLLPRRLLPPVDLPLPAVTVVVLTAEQELAVARRAEPLLLSAAAGSGKTSVLVERFVAAVREDGLAPSRILAITFTERAAGELRARVRARLLELGDRDAARDTEAAFVGTFHGFCARMLRTHPLAAGLDPAFTILDEGHAGRLREQAFAAALRDLLAGERGASSPASSPEGEGEGEAVDTLAAYGVERTRLMIEHIHAELRTRGQRLPRLPQPRQAEAEPDIAAARTCALLDQLLQGFARAYEQLKRTRAAVDFDDLELIAAELLNTRQDLRSAWCERFELLMVDEFQDTNPRQLGILAALERGNLFTVGDELQSIYGFRHADVSLFRARRRALEEVGGSLRLTRNFRARQSLLHVVNAVFAERFPDYSPLVAGAGIEGGAGAQRADAASSEPEVELLLTDVRGWEEREDLAAPIAAGLPHAQLWRQAEARLLAQRVAELVRAGVARAGEVAVLLRAVGDLEVFERALQLQGLRTLAAVGAFWGHQQVADLICWLRALANPLDEQALYGALASPLGGCSLDCLALLAQAARDDGRGVWQTALAAVRQQGRDAGDPHDSPHGEQGAAALAARLAVHDRQALSSFCQRLRDERDGAARRTIAELMLRAIDAGSYRRHVLALDWPERRLANIHKLLRLARRFEASQGRDLRAFLDHIVFLEGTAQVEPDAPVASSREEGLEPDAVRLMTVHAAKGLEFPVVCLADLGRQPNLQTPDLLVASSPASSPEGEGEGEGDGERVGLRLVRLDGSRSTPALDYESLCAERRQREAEEEDRILYVAMTRARERLLLSGAADFARWPSSRAGAAAITWLAPALSTELPQLAQAAQAAIHDLPVGAAGSVRCLFNTPATVGSVLRLQGPHGAPSGAVHTPTAGQAADDARQPSAGAPDGEGEQLSLDLAGAPSSILNIKTDAAAQRLLAPTLSYTSLTELQRCGYRYYLERVLGLPEQAVAEPRAPGRRRLEARARGTLIHRLLESLDFARPRAISPEEVGELARRLGMRVDGVERAEIAGLIGAALAAEPAARVARAVSVKREYPFSFSLSASGEDAEGATAGSAGDDATGPDAPLITGVIDLLARERDGGWLVLDYKSDRLQAASSPEAGADLAALVEEHYAVQRELYGLALLRAGAPSVEVVHWFLERPHQPVHARYGAEDRRELQERLAVRLARAREQPFAVSPRPHAALCLSCPGRGSLCSWDDAHTLRENPVQGAVR